MRGGGTFIRDNMEAFAVAIAMALVIRHYCLEAFRIPTGSMMPTLLGEHVDAENRRRPGDRILVDKLSFQRGDPRRFEVAVFQYPLNRNQNFIKRIAGLPNEWLRIVDGDLWTSRDQGRTWSIARKPAAVREQLFFPYYPEPVGAPDAFRGVTCWEYDRGWKVDERRRCLEVDTGAETGALEFRRKILPYDREHNDTFGAPRPFVGDVRVSFDVAFSRLGTLTVRIVEHGRHQRLVLGPDGSRVVFEGADGAIPLPFRFAEGETYSVSFANVDDTLVVEVDGDMEEIPFPGVATQPPDEREYAMGGSWGDHGIFLEGRDCAAVLTDPRVDRDVHYDAGEGDPEHIWKIPADHYFMLGDNTIHSRDSRKWQVAEVVLKSGEVIRWETNPTDGTPNPGWRRPAGGDDRISVVAADVDGIRRVFRSGDVERWGDGLQPWPYVSRDHLIGRAFAVFWPFYVPPLYAGPTRIKLIR